MSETTISRQIRHAVTSTRRASLWRNNVGFASAERVTYGLAVGSADLIGFVHSTGKFFALEVKTPKGRTSPDQIAWRDYVNTHGGFAAIVRSVEDALSALDAASN